MGNNLSKIDNIKIIPSQYFALECADIMNGSICIECEITKNSFKLIHAYAFLFGNLYVDINGVHKDVKCSRPILSKTQKKTVMIITKDLFKALMAKHNIDYEQKEYKKLIKDFLKNNILTFVVNNNGETSIIGCFGAKSSLKNFDYSKTQLVKTRSYNKSDGFSKVECLRRGCFLKNNFNSNVGFIEFKGWYENFVKDNKKK